MLEHLAERAPAPPPAPRCKRAGQPLHACLERLQVGERVVARHRLDAADAGGDAAFRDDLEQADVAGARDVGAAAELAARADVEHADLVAVLLAEQHHGAELRAPPRSA